MAPYITLQGADCMGFDQIKYADAYNKERYDQLTVRIPKGRKQVWKKYADKHGMSVSALVNQCVENEIENENENP